MDPMDEVLEWLKKFATDALKQQQDGEKQDRRIAFKQAEALERIAKALENKGVLS